MQRAQSRLTLRLYDTPHVRLFGLRGSQCCDNKDFVPYAGWFNERGERVGCGALEREHLLGIKEGLRFTERFIILPWQNAYHRLRPHPAVDRFPRFACSYRDPDSPGLEYVARHATWVIAPGVIYRVQRDDLAVFTSEERLLWSWITPEQVHEILHVSSSELQHVDNCRRV